MVAVCEKCVRVRLGHDLAGSVLNEDALDSAATDRSGGDDVELFHEIPKNRHEESGGAEQGLEESGGGEFAGIPDDQPGLVCDEIKVG